MPSPRAWLLALLVLGLASPLFALDPRIPNYEFKYSLYPPGGLNPKRAKVIPRPDPKQPKASPLIDKNGKFSEWAQWYYEIATDPKAFETWWMGYWTDASVWKPAETFVYKGTSPGNQGHRIIAFLGTVYNAVQRDPDIDPEVKRRMCTEEWRRAAEQIIRRTIDGRGFLGYGPNQGNMAQTFHFLRTKFGAMKLLVPNIYTLDHAQDCIVTLLTAPNVICEEDKWLAPPDPEILETIGRQKRGLESDIRWVHDGKVLFTGGLFIGWNDKPSLHGTWDGLSILNTLFRYYPDPDPASPKSIFYKWNQLPEEKRQIGKKMITLCARRLWLDWKENHRPIWCWLRDGKPTEDDSRPTEAPWMPAYDGYGDNQLAWAKVAWEEVFGDPERNTNDGCQALLAIAQGRVLRKLKAPIGQQVPGRYDFDAETKKKWIAEDLKRLSPSPEEMKEFAARLQKWGLSDSVTSAGIAEETPKLDPRKSTIGTAEGQ